MKAGNKNRTHLALGLGFLLGLAAIFPVVSPRADSARNTTLKDLEGKWQIVPDQSDDFKAKVDAALGNGGGFLARQKRARARDAVQQLAEAASLLTIRCGENDVTISGNADRSRTLYLDGRKQQMETPRGRRIELITRWQNDHLVIHGQNSMGVVVDQTISLLPGQRRLQVWFKVESEHLSEPLELRSVYEPVEN